MSTKIDLNCDLGEWRQANGAEKDALIMPFITSCNVACGGHIGDEESMKSTIRLAKEHGVKIGAHPSFPDQENFGRVVMKMESEELFNALVSQIQSLIALLDEAGESLHHIKPHGALYNYAAKDVVTAKVIINSVVSFSKDIPLYAQQGSVLAREAEAAGLKVIYEVFADRAYEEDLSLRSRKLEGAVLHQTEEVLSQIEQMVGLGRVITYSGLTKSITAQTICLHSDTEGSIHLAKQIHDYLRDRDVEIAAP